MYKLVVSFEQRYVSIHRSRIGCHGVIVEGPDHAYHTPQAAGCGETHIDTDDLEIVLPPRKALLASLANLGSLAHAYHDSRGWSSLAR